ncbi:hypothetical protein [Microbacterium halotolerans]|uniref:DUF7927 domain-containing protein n=1 Tax=Microbacterium halotolerans TaxID=246613 RepID=UPI0013C350A3|nr:hypothetical protein [Microbacterium halotolerans]
MSRQDHGGSTVERVPRRSSASFVVAVLITALVSIAGVLGTAPPAFAAAGDYSVDLTGPASADVGSSFTYTVALEAEVTSGDPAEDVVLTLMLDPHLDVDAVATGGTSPVESYEYDETTGELTVLLNDLTDVHSSFAVSVTQKNINDLDPTSTYTTTVTGTQTPSGVEPTDSHTTDVTGEVSFRTDKRMSIQPGTGNRVVVYRFPIIGHNSDTTGYFSSAAQRLVDELAPGAEVLDSSAGPGEWTFTGDASTGITATFENTGTFRVGQLSNDVWLRVSYPSAAFPEGTQPPLNTVSLSVQDQAGVWYDDIHQATVQPQEVNDGAPVPMTAVEKDMPGAATNGSRFDTTVSGYYADGGQDVDAESIVLEDVASYADNAAYFDGAAARELRFNSNTILQAADLPLTLEVQFDGGAWQVADSTRTTGQGQYRVGFVADGSTSGVGGTHASVNFLSGAVLTGWRLTVSPDAATTVPTGSRVNATLLAYASYTGDPGGSIDVSNTATMTAEVEGGPTLSSEADADLTIHDAVAVRTVIDAPSTLVVGEPAEYQVCAANNDQVRDYQDVVMNVVLPEGIVYDSEVGVSVAEGGANSVPPVEVGDGLAVEQTVMADGRRLVTFTFDEVPPHQSWRQPQHSGTAAWCYTLPVDVSLGAYIDAENESIEAESWVHIDDPQFDGVRYNEPGGSPTVADDIHDLDAGSERIVFHSDSSTVITGGGMSVEKTASPDGVGWATDQTAAEDGSAFWRIQTVNTLPAEVTNVTVFDHLPEAGDANGSDLGTVLTGPVQGPDGVTIEYSSDATSATDGTWDTAWEGATSWRASEDLAAVGDTSEFLVPVQLDQGLAAEQAVNQAVVLYEYNSQQAEADTNESTLSPLPVPEIKAAKSVDPESGSAVLAGQDVIYELTFSNSGNVEGPVDYTDDLSGVLDDAALVGDPEVPDPALSVVIDSEIIAVTGSLDVEQEVTVTYTVTVGEDFARGDDLLENLLAPTSVDDPQCGDEGVECTSNPVRDQPTEPTPEEPSDPAPEEEPTPEEPSNPAPEEPDNGDELAVTGSTIAGTAAAAGMLALLVGAGITLAARRRTEVQEATRP